MSFTFGSNTVSQTSAFGATPAKPSFSFGGANTSTTPSAGFGFGTTTSTGFGTANTTGFGGFGATAAPAATSFGGLGAMPATTATSLFGGTGFGNTAAKPATGFGAGFGTNTFGTGTGFGASTAPFGTSAPAFGTTAPAFGTTAPAFGTTAPAFGTTAPAFGTTAPAFGTNTLGGATSFGTSNFGAGSTLGGAFGAKPAATGFGGFGAGLGQTNQFGQPQQQQQQQQQPQGPANATEALVAAVYNCCVFGDERDTVLAKWNLLQAQWGTGQAYYSRNAPALELNEQNPLCRFKAVGYSKLSRKEETHGHVTMIFNKTEQDIKNNQQALVTSLNSLLGNKPNLAVTVDSVKAIAETKSQVIIYVVDKNAGNSHVAAGELSNFLNGGAARTALGGAGCIAVTPCGAPAQNALQHYLSTPPPGMDSRLWKQAQADNPDPDNYIPVPMIGFSEVKFRAKCQTEQARLQAEFLKRTDEELGELRTRRAASAARLTQLSARLHRLRHTLLQVVGHHEVMGRVGAALAPEEEAARARIHELASQLSAPPLYNVVGHHEVMGRVGAALAPEEEAARARIHELASQLSAPPLYNGRLNELLCAVRLQRSASAGAPVERYHLDPGAQEDVKQFLSMQQRGMAHLLDTARSDLAALNTIAEGMAKLVRA